MSEKIIFVKKKIEDVIYIESNPKEENGYDPNYDIDYDVIGDGSYYEVTNINHVIDALLQLNAKGATSVEIDYNIDHGEMMITGYEFRKANEEELKKYFDEIEEEKRISREIQIKHLEEKLEKLKNTK